VPVGVFLSGGIDSSTNAALFSEGEGHPVRTFSIGYDREYQSYPSELRYARQMAGLVGAEHHELLLNENDLFESLPRIIRHQDEPLADPVCMPVYYVSKLARDNGVIVCQVGEGSDELFCGYGYWRDSLRMQRYSRTLPLPKPLRALGLAALPLIEGGTGASYTRQFSCEILRRALSNRPVFWGGAEVFSDSQKRQFFAPRLRKQFADFSSWEALKPIHRRFEEKAWDRSPLHWMTYLDLNLRLPELLLMRVDKMSMAVSLEARVPFLDYKFVELAMSIPAAVKTKNGVLKYILKKAVRGVIPDELIDRTKQGFGVPVYEWYHTKYGEYLAQEMKEFCDNTDFFRFDALSPLLKRRGWALLNLALWWKHYIGSPKPAPLPRPIVSETQPVKRQAVANPA
jgi:asparagine synthase (glutamine-hydrolysing)